MSHETAQRLGRRSALVDRTFLHELLDAGSLGQFTAVVAPAGSGKTELLRSWLAASDRPENAVWVSVERGERDPQRFWSALTAEVSRALMLDARLVEVATAPSFHAEAVLAKLVNELRSVRRRLTIVIDDLHEIKSADILSQLTQFLSELPSDVHMVLISRHDPQLGLHRRRLQGDVTELRMNELRFSITEARQLLLGVGVELSPVGLELLHSRTEGWVAGLRLAALSLSTHPDPERFVQEFSGSEKTVAEYLLAEVLDTQPPEVRRLLVRTSILDKVNGALGDLLAGDSGTERHLKALADAGSFVIALDAGETWFRFHHLFSDLLAAQLRNSEPAAVPQLHLLAAQWHREMGDVTEAISHALAADAPDLATSMLVEHYFSLLLDGRQATLRWLVDATMSRSASVELAVLTAADELIDGSLEEAAAQLGLSVRRAGDLPADRQQAFDLILYVTQLALARRVGDFHSIIKAVRPAVLAQEPQTARDLSTQTDLRTWLLMNLGIVEVWTGRLEDGERHLEEAGSIALRLGRPYLEASCSAHRAQSISWRSPALALPVARQAVAIAERSGLQDDPIAGVAHVALGSCLIAVGQTELAEEEFCRANETLRSDLEPAVGFVLQTGHGVVHLVNGRYTNAIDSFLEAERLGKSLVVSSPLALQARCAMLYAAVLAGNDRLVATALLELSESERDTDEVREVMAAQAIAQGDGRSAIAALNPQRGASPQIYSGMILTRSMLLDAKARYLLGDDVQGRTSVEAALDLAEIDELILPFLWIDSTELLERHPRKTTSHAGFLTFIKDTLSGRGAIGPQDRFARSHVELSEPELRILRFLPTNLTAGDIASEIHVSVNTVKTHMRSIYLKLEAHSRSQAVDCARRAGLLGRHSQPR